MATAFKINVPSSDTGLFDVKQSDAVASKLSGLLQDDMEVSLSYSRSSTYSNT